MLCSSLISFAILGLVAGYIVEPGPRVKATRGEVWPKPQYQEWGQGYMVLRPTVFKFREISEKCDFLQETLQRYWKIIVESTSLGRRGKRSKHASQPRDYKVWRNDPSFMGYLDILDVSLGQPCGPTDLPALNMDERYNLNISMPQAEYGLLKSQSIWGVMRGLETFSQLLYLADDGVALIINSSNIIDFPRFSHRGLLLDTSRHFLPMFSILQTLDAMSYNKMNVFHWHIVDDQSFPYESTIFPELSLKGAYHPEFMIYSSNDVQKVIQHARNRGIRVMVEFDTPGHTRSWGEGIPKLLTTCYGRSKPNGYFGPIDPSRNFTYEFLHKFFKEVVSVFPEKYMHLGGDEVDFDCWKSNPMINKFMSDNAILTYPELEEYYIQKLIQIVDKLRASSVVWEEVFVNGVKLPPKTVVHVWKGGTDAGVLYNITKQGLQALWSACWYLDNISGGGDWQKYYDCDPHFFPGSDEQKELLIGGEACMWGEVVDATNLATRVWPRACAVAEKLWSNRNVTDIQEAAKRLEEHACRMQIRGVPAQPPNGPGFCL